jgi:hypothetical protein
MQVSKFWVIALRAALAAAAASSAATQVSAQTKHVKAQVEEVRTISDREACRTEREVFPLHAAAGFNALVAVHFAKDGIVLETHKGKMEPLDYADIAKIDFSPGAFSHADLYIHTKDKRGSHFIEFFLTQASNEKVQALQSAIMKLAQDAQAGHPFLCSDDPQDYAAALAEFQEKTAAWRELATKPAVSEEVYKDRLLAEDALKNRDLRGAAKFYEAGIASEFTWAQGWYNAALVYAELNEYADAADCMKHYVVLMPDAQDVQPAKDNIILWEAKAPHAQAPVTLQAAKKK